MTNSWRALARMARDRIVTSDPSDLTLILGVRLFSTFFSQPGNNHIRFEQLWHIRLSCLARLRLFNQTSAECTNLFTVLNAIEPLESRAYVMERILPFELEVMQTRLKYWAGDHMGYLDALNGLLTKCRIKSRQSNSDPNVMPMWKERGARLCLIIASEMVEIKVGCLVGTQDAYSFISVRQEFTAAARLLEPLCDQGDGATSPALRSSVARIYLQGGDVGMASKHFKQVAEDPTAEETLKQMNAALLACAVGDWEEASGTLKAILERDAENYAVKLKISAWRDSV